jgi:hypothetical protein
MIRVYEVSIGGTIQHGEQRQHSDSASHYTVQCVQKLRIPLISRLSLLWLLHSGPWPYHPSLYKRTLTFRSTSWTQHSRSARNWWLQIHYSLERGGIFEVLSRNSAPPANESTVPENRVEQLNRSEPHRKDEPMNRRKNRSLGFSEKLKAPEGAGTSFGERAAARTSRSGEVEPCGASTLETDSSSLSSDATSSSEPAVAEDMEKVRSRRSRYAKKRGYVEE